MIQDQQQAKKPANITESTVLGKPHSRVDGPLKTTGTAMYSSDHHFDGLVYAWPATATISSGSITGVDASLARKMPGVLAVYTHETIGPLYRTPPGSGFSMILDEKRPALEDTTVSYYGQYVAVAVASTLEQARAAAESIKVTYAKTPHNTDEKLLEDAGAKSGRKTAYKRGDTAGITSAPVKHDAVYSTPAETHNPIELHASVAVFKEGKYTLYETSQAVVNSRDVLAAQLGVPSENVQVITRFLGSGFGGKLWPWPHAALAAACSRNLKLPVKLVVSRSMMFESVGHRPAIDQHVKLAAETSGKLLAIEHDYVNHTSMLDDYDEGCGEATGILYSCHNVTVSSGLARRNIGTPTSMRGPGAVPGLYALESAMDELALKLKLDPVQLRLTNEPAKDESTGQEFSSRHLKECLTTGAERFGWSKRNPAIGSMKSEEGTILGWGVAACTWIAARMESEATVELLQDGSARVTCGTQDIGTGTYTVIAQMVAHETGIPVDRIDVVLGDSSLPPGPISGGSWATASVVPAVLQAAQSATQKLLVAAVGTANGPFSGKESKALEFANGGVQEIGKPGTHVTTAAVISMARVKAISGQGKSVGTLGNPNEKLSSHSYGAHFVEVSWQPEIARLRATRIVTVIDAGRIINPRAARNQIEGAIVMGIGMAMLEATEYDQRSGAPINSNLADYVVAVNADCPPIDVLFLDYPDFNLNAIGARGVGEIGLAGVAAAIANAVHHATGIRVRSLPIRIEDLLADPASHEGRLSA